MEVFPPLYRTMSSGDIHPPEQVPQPAEAHDSEIFHPDFTSPSGDFVICSSDKVRFRVHRVFLQEASPVFRTMLTLPQPPSSANTPPFIDLPEDSATTASLLRLIYPIAVPSFENLDGLSKVLFAAEKYDMPGALSTLRRFLLERQYLNTDPVHVYALARRFGWKEEAHLASRFTLVFDVHDPKYLAVFTATGISTTDIFALFVMRHKRIEGMCSYLDGDEFEGNAIAYECQSCGKILNDITWPFFKAAILKEMYRRPLGDGIFGAEFLKSKAMGAFVAGKCSTCGEKCYDKGWTLSKLKDYLDSLPDCACDSW